MKARKNTRLVCISDFRVATYSGMLPGVLAGQYPPERMEMDLDRLCASSGTELIVDRVVGLDAKNKLLLFANRRELPFDVLSVGIGSRPSIPAKVQINAEMLIPIKPMQTFLSRLDARLSFVRQMRQNAPIRIVVVGAGLGGTEIALLQQWL